MFCCALLCGHSSFAIVLMGKRGLVALLRLSSWCLMIVVWLFLMMPRVCLQFVIVVFPDHTHLLLLYRDTLSETVGSRAPDGLYVTLPSRHLPSLFKFWPWDIKRPPPRDSCVLYRYMFKDNKNILVQNHKA